MADASVKYIDMLARLNNFANTHYNDSGIVVKIRRCICSFPPFYLIILLSAYSGGFCYTQKLAFIYDAIAVPGFDVKCRIYSMKTISLNHSSNPISYSGYRHWRVLSFQPECRLLSFTFLSGLFISISKPFLAIV